MGQIHALTCSVAHSQVIPVYTIMHTWEMLLRGLVSQISRSVLRSTYHFKFLCNLIVLRMNIPTITLLSLSVSRI